MMSHPRVEQTTDTIGHTPRVASSPVIWPRFVSSHAPRSNRRPKHRIAGNPREQRPRGGAPGACAHRTRPRGVASPSGFLSLAEPTPLITPVVSLLGRTEWADSSRAPRFWATLDADSIRSFVPDLPVLLPVAS